MKVVTLKNGAEEAESLVLLTTMSLRTLMREYPIAFYELVQLCKDHNHRLLDNAGEILDRLGFVQNGIVHDSFRNIVLSAVEGDKLDMRLTSLIVTV